MSTVPRFTAYTLTVLLFAASLPGVVQHFGIAVFREGGPIEWFQFGLIVATTAVFFAGAASLPHFRHLFVLVACVFVALGFREQDAHLDQALPWMGWKIGLVAVLYAAVWGYAHRQILKAQLPPLFLTRAFAVLWGGFLVAFPIAQLVGHGPFLQAAMGADYVYGYKHMIEEILELMGYLLLLAGSFESVIQLAAAPASRAPGAAMMDRRAAFGATIPPSFSGASRRARKPPASAQIHAWRPRRRR